MARVFSRPVTTTTELEALWLSLADDPERQALEVAQVCIAQAPHLAAWLERFISRKLPDTLYKQLLFHEPHDGRIQAINRLLACKYQRQSKPAAPQVQRPVQRRPARRRQPKHALEEAFTAIFGVVPKIIQHLPLLRVDWELGRLTVKFGDAAEFRLWVMARDLTASEHGSGVIKKAQLWDRVQGYRIPYTKRHFNRLLKAGHGRFWHMLGDRLYLCGYRALAQGYAAHSDEYEGGNLPGVRAVYLDPSGSLERWEAMLYAGWITGRGYKHDITISRDVLAQLFGRHANTIRKWEADRLAGTLSKRTNFAQCAEPDRYLNAIPLHAQTYVARTPFRGQTVEHVRLRWQLPNTYHATISSHAHRGQASKVRRAVACEYPVHEQRDGHCLRYVLSYEELKKRFRSLKFRMGKYGDPNRPVYVYLGDHKRSRAGIFEITTSGFLMTQANERLRPAEEQVYLRIHPAPLQAVLRFWQNEAKAAHLLHEKLGHFLEAQ